MGVCLQGEVVLGKTGHLAVPVNCGHLAVARRGVFLFVGGESGHIGRNTVGAVDETVTCVFLFGLNSLRMRVMERLFERGWVRG